MTSDEPQSRKDTPILAAPDGGRQAWDDPARGPGLQSLQWRGRNELTALAVDEEVEEEPGVVAAEAYGAAQDEGDGT